MRRTVNIDWDGKTEIGKAPPVPGAAAVFWLISLDELSNGIIQGHQWEHKGWLMPETG